ncbi:hypothetical protein QF205_03710 [Luteimonas composti]|uniref:DUF4252 domain-containing protein n=1 Tax=Luteimonas composti TaxID=398257 RepID=A0ABT6MNQ6_9GAMM|nr:hypothetical protein [Luteimonas composti]MDH7452189.1 hypothetical protein [Luteimonas composti]
MSKRSSGRACALVLAIAALGAGAAHAQDGAVGEGRSIASAQEFLRQVLPGNRYASTMMSEILERAGRQGLRGHFEPLPPVFDAAPLAECRSLLLADIRATDLVVRDPATGERAVSALADLVDDNAVGSPDGFDFGSIRALRQSGNRVLLRFAGEQSDAVLYLEGEEMAARVHAALDYLRRHCDASAATGF